MTVEPAVARSADPRRLAWMRLWSVYVSDLLTRAGIEHLVFKGATWMPPLERETVSADVDVLVAPGEVERALVVLRAAGMTSCYGLSAAEEALHSFTLKIDEGPQVDLHRGFPGLDHDRPGFWSWAWETRAQAFLGHRLVDVPGLQAQLAIALAGAMRDGASSSSAQRVRQALPTVDWTSLLPPLQRLGAASAVRGGLMVVGEQALADSLALPAVPPRFRDHRTQGSRRIEELLTEPWRRRLPIALRELWPSRAFLAMAHPLDSVPRARVRHSRKVVVELPGALWAAAARRMGRG